MIKFPIIILFITFCFLKSQEHNESALLISLLFNEHIEWFQFFVNMTNRAVKVKHYIVVSTNPKIIQNLTALNEENVYFSEAFEKGGKIGLSLLEGHMKNIEYGLQNFNFTHAVLLTSNNMWIKRVTEKYLGFSIHLLQDLLPLYNPICQSIESARKEKKWWWHNFINDGLAMNIIQENNIRTVCGIFHEGVFGPHSSWKKITHFFNHTRIFHRRNELNQFYPAEEFTLPTVIHHLGLSNTMKKTNVLTDDNDEPQKIREIRAARNHPYMLVIKSVPRAPNHPIFKYCEENEY